jgi:hypothetical protein
LASSLLDSYFSYFNNFNLAIWQWEGEREREAERGRERERELPGMRDEVPTADYRNAAGLVPIYI